MSFYALEPNCFIILRLTLCVPLMNAMCLSSFFSMHDCPEETIIEKVVVINCGDYTW